MLIFKELTFDAAHQLPQLPEGHKCRELHGHTYRLKIWLEGEPDTLGWVMDFSEIKKRIKPTIDLVDHTLLNNVAGLEHPTCELLAIWLWNRLKPELPLLKKIELNETPSSGVVYEGV